MLIPSLLPLLSPDVFARLDAFASLVLAANERLNLTAITDPADFTVKHVADSLTLLPLLAEADAQLLDTGSISAAQAKSTASDGLRGNSESQADASAQLLDVGTGAGFPGMVLAIAAEEHPRSVTLLDATRKKCDFLRDAAEELGVAVEVVWGRAEELGRQGQPLHARFDVVTARAVAAMPQLCRWCLPCVKPGGRFIAMKGQTVEPFERELARYGGRHVETRELTVGGMARQLVVVEK